MICKGIPSSPSLHANSLSSTEAGSFQPEVNFKMKLLMEHDSIHGRQANGQQIQVELKWLLTSQVNILLD